MNAQDLDDWGTQETPQKSRGGRPAKGYAARSNRKIECPECGWHARTSAAQLSRGLPTCACGAGMIVPEFRDRVALSDPDALEHVERAEAEECERAFRAAPRERRAGAPKRCAELGCHKFVRGEYCDEHKLGAERSEGMGAYR